MNELVLMAYEFSTLLIPTVIAFCFLCGAYRRRRIACSKMHLPLILIFALYLLGIFSVTGVGTVFHIRMYGFTIRPGEVNLLPFSLEIDKMAYLLNVVMFVPFGILLPWIWLRTERFLTVLFSGFSFSLLIECSQLFNHRSTDVDDLIMNTAGAVLGYLLFKLFHRRPRRSQTGYFACEPALYTCVMFLGHFLLYNSYGAAKLLYGF